MKIDIKTLAYMYGVTDMYTQLRIMQEDGKTKFAAHRGNVPRLSAG